MSECGCAICVVRKRRRLAIAPILLLFSYILIKFVAPFVTPSRTVYIIELLACLIRRMNNWETPAHGHWNTVLELIPDESMYYNVIIATPVVDEGLLMPDFVHFNLLSCSCCRFESFESKVRYIVRGRDRSLLCDMNAAIVYGGIAHAVSTPMTSDRDISDSS